MTISSTTSLALQPIQLIQLIQLQHLTQQMLRPIPILPFQTVMWVGSQGASGCVGMPLVGIRGGVGKASTALLPFLYDILLL